MDTISATRSTHSAAAHGHGLLGLTDARGRNVYGARSNRLRDLRHHHHSAIIDWIVGLEPEP